MEIECPETESTFDDSNCDCYPKCEHYQNILKRRIRSLESAMQEFVEKENKCKTVYEANELAGVTAEKFKQLLTPKQSEG